MLTKIIKDALQNANLTNEQALAVFQNNSKENAEVVVSMVIKQLSAQTIRLFQIFLEEIMVDFKVSVLSVAHGTTEQILPE